MRTKSKKYNRKAGAEDNIEFSKTKQQNQQFIPEDNKRQPEEYRRGPEEYRRGPEEYRRQPEEYRREPEEYRRGPEEYRREPEEYRREPEEYRREPEEYIETQDEPYIENEEPSQSIEPEPLMSESKNEKNNKYRLLISIIITLVALSILGLGVYIFLRKTKYNNSINATVINASCEPGTSICLIDIKYNIYNVDYIQKSISVQSLFKIGDTVSILYDSENPNKFVIAQPKWIRIVVGSFITLLALILLIVTWWYYIRK